MPNTSGYHDPYDDGYPEEDDPRFHGDDWKRDSGHSAEPEPPPPIPADVLTWYRAALRRWLTTELFDRDGGLGWIAKYQKWYEDRPHEFLALEPSPGIFSMAGGWRLDASAMWEAVDLADKELNYREGQPADRPPVEPATEADVDAALARMQDGRPPEEDHTSFVLHRSGGDPDHWRETRHRIRAKTPIPCRCCGEFFRVEPGQHLANCLECRSAGRKRCHDCNEVFSPAHNRVRRCGSCLAIDAELKARRNRH
jgi:hypothetical protein